MTGDRYGKVKFVIEFNEIKGSGKHWVAEMDESTGELKFLKPSAINGRFDRSSRVISVSFRILEKSPGPIVSPECTGITVALPSECLRNT